MTYELIGPVLAQVALTLAVFILLYVRRLPAMAAAKPSNEAMQDKGNLDKLPKPAQFVAQNYNHQFEAPVLFYVLCLVATLIGAVNELIVLLAWAYVGLRVLHAIIHCTYNKVLHRFAVFSLSGIALMALWALTLQAYLQG
jgi:hypothetical protein